MIQVIRLDTYAWAKIAVPSLFLWWSLFYSDTTVAAPAATFPDYGVSNVPMSRKLKTKRKN